MIYAKTKDGCYFAMEIKCQIDKLTLFEIILTSLCATSRVAFSAKHLSLKSFLFLASWPRGKRLHETALLLGLCLPITCVWPANDDSIFSSKTGESLPKHIDLETHKLRL